MKLFTLWRFTLISALFSLLGIGSAWAQLTELEVGKVYHFANARYENYALGVNASEKVRGVTPIDKSDYNQLWIVAEKNASGQYRLQSLGHGGYLQAKGQDTEWLLVDANTTTDTYLVLDKTGTNNVFRGANYGTYGYANVASGHSYKILGWTHNNDLGSQWTIEKQELDEATLNNALDNRVNTNSAVRTAVETALANLFTDAACTTKKKSLTAAQLDADEDYLALTPTLQEMAKKVYSDAWQETNFDNNKDPWGDDYAKKYRVQWYEPYTEPECAAKALRINAHTNLNNPTGIFANQGDVLFVMVEGEIKEGAYLYLASYTGHNRLSGYADGVELHQGLNVVPVTEDGTNYCINYVVKTFDTTNGTGKNAIIEGRELSKYPDLQIHIEGGYINGYWNKMGDAVAHNGDFNYPADTDADWDYIKERATQTDVTVLGQYVTLQFPLTDAGTGDDKGMATYFNSYKDKTTSLRASIDEWDRVMIWERLLMGVVGEDIIEAEDKKSPYSDQLKVTAFTGHDADDFGCDYSEYYRVHGLSFGTEGGYMYGGWDHCGYNFNTMESILLSMVDESGPHWGPAHEIGHQHQGPLNMRGLTEVTNNLFSNVVLWYFGKSTARYNGTDGALSNVLAQFNAEGTDFFSNNIWAQTIMYYKLFLYYHVLGHNPKFYPRLFEMLRQDPMTIEYNQDGGKCLMHFYKKCCDAAGEDLTEFFRAHGFFEVMEERFVGDYSNAVYNLTQTQIDQAIAEVKAKPYPTNLAVLFITDATGEGNIKSNRGNDVYLTHFDTNNSGNLISGELGNYATFNTVVAPNYNYTISGNSVTMEGEGGIGFAILNEQGELIGFSDKKTFEISQETMEAISNGEATIVVMPASGAPVPAVSTMSESDIERTLLADLIEQAETMVALIDDEGKKIGYYKSSYTTELQASLTKAKEVYANSEENAYTPAFNALKAVMDDLKSKAYAKIAMKAGVYTVRNQAYPARYMSVNGSDKLITTANAEQTDAEKWTFEQGNGHGHYYIKSVSTGKYINALEQSKEVNATTTEILDAKEWLVEDLGNGVFGITCQDDNNQSIHCDAGHKIVGWNTGATASHWYLTALETEELSAEQQALEELIVLSEDMLKRVATIETATEGFALDANSYYCNAPMTANWYGDGFKGYRVLFDEDYSTYLHTDYTGKDSDDGLDHYLRVDLGENNSASLFTFYYATRNSSKQNPTAIVVEGSNTAGGEYEVIANLTREADNLIAGAESEYVSAVLGQSNKSYRYLRFRVTATVSNEKAGPEDGKKYIFFVFSEFGVSKAICSVTPLAKYSTLTSDYVTEVFNKIREAKYVYANADNAADYTAAKEALQTYYNNLLDVYNNQELTALNNKKDELQTLINQATALINECGKFSYVEAKDLSLNTNTTPYKLSDNNGASEGSLDKLYDGKLDKSYSYTSSWSDTPTEPSYLQVDLGAGNELEELIFTFTNRNEGNAPTPTEIVVSASTDGKEFTVLDTFTSAEPNWPPAANNQTITATKWTSPVIQASSACRYWRFTVTKSYRSTGDETNSNGIYHYGISEFGLQQPEQNILIFTFPSEEVTAELLFSVYNKVAESEQVIKYATNNEALDKAIAKLQERYNALSAAKQAAIQSTKQTAQELLDATANKVGYPSKDAQTTLQTAITEGNDVNTILAAVKVYKESDAITMPESGKAYVFTNVHPAGGKKYLNYSEDGLTMVARGDHAANDLPESAKWYCRKMESGQYVFVNSAGKYLVFKGSDNGTNGNKGYVDAYDATYSPITFVKMTTSDYTGATEQEDLFGYVAFGGRRIYNGTSAYFVTTSGGGFQQDTGWTLRYDNNYSTAFIVEEVTNYPFANTKLTETSKDKDTLLKGIENGQTVSTFSAPYATVIPNGVTAYYAKKAEQGETLYLTAVEEKAIPACQGVILIGNVEVTSTNFVPATTEILADLSGNALANTATGDVYAGASDYALAKGDDGIGIYKVKEGTRIKAGKAYLSFDSSSSARSFVLSFNAKPTAIEDALTDAEESTIYDLYGRRVTEVTKSGIYIVNGKKVFIK